MARLQHLVPAAKNAPPAALFYFFRTNCWKLSESGGPSLTFRCYVCVMSKQIDTYLLLKYFRCETNAEEEKQIAVWLSEDPEGKHAKAYRDARILFEGMVLYSQEAKEENKCGFRISKLLRIAARTAAAAVIVALSVFAGSRLVRKTYIKEYRAYNIAAGSSMQMTLEDGTELWLKGGTAVEIPLILGEKERNIRLKSGEIFLNVARDEHRPFTLDTYAGRIEVLGTKFNVEADEKHGLFETSLIEGSVRISTPEGKNFVMKANDVVTLKDDEWKVGRMNNPYSVTCWMDGLIDIANISFQDLMYEFEKSFDVEVVIAREKLPELTFTRGKIRVSDGVESALKLLKLSADFDYDIDRNTGTIYIR